MAESMPPEAIGSLKGAGLKVDTTIYPAILKWNFSYVPGSPLLDLRVRKAANLAIDREGLVKLLNNTAVAAKSYVDESSPWFAEGTFKLRYDPVEAKRLLAEAGFSPSNRLKLTTRFPVAAMGK